MLIYVKELNSLLQTIPSHVGNFSYIFPANGENHSQYPLENHQRYLCPSLIFSVTKSHSQLSTSSNFKLNPQLLGNNLIWQIWILDIENRDLNSVLHHQNNENSENHQNPLFSQLEINSKLVATWGGLVQEKQMYFSKKSEMRSIFLWPSASLQHCHNLGHQQFTILINNKKIHWSGHH
jgi:hypothetical protein